MLGLCGLVFWSLLAGCTGGSIPDPAARVGLLPWTRAAASGELEPGEIATLQQEDPRSAARHAMLERVLDSLTFQSLPPAPPAGGARLKMAFGTLCEGAEACTFDWEAQVGKMARLGANSAEWVAPEVPPGERKTFRTRLLVQILFKRNLMGESEGRTRQFILTMGSDGAPIVSEERVYGGEFDEVDSLLDFAQTRHAQARLIAGVSYAVIAPLAEGQLERLRLTFDESAVEPNVTWKWVSTSGTLTPEDRFNTLWVPPLAALGAEPQFEAFLKCTFLSWKARQVMRQVLELHVTMTRGRRLAVSQHPSWSTAETE
jgi:hypothetical protein